MTQFGDSSQQTFTAPRYCHRTLRMSYKRNRSKYGGIRRDRTTWDMAERKAVVKNADMSEEMQQEAVDCATEAMEKYNIEKDIAAHIKKEFDKRYNPTWHCIVGRNFGR